MDVRTPSVPMWVHDALTRAPSYGIPQDRDLIYPLPVTDAEKADLANTKVLWFNTDRQWLESYYAPATTPGLDVVGLRAGTAAGWYPVASGPFINLVPSAQMVLTAGLTFTNFAAPGTGLSYKNGGSEYFSYSGGVITCLKAGRYRIGVSLSVEAGAGAGSLYVIRNNSTSAVNIVSQDAKSLISNLGVMFRMPGEEVAMAAGDNLRIYAASVGSATFAVGASPTIRSAGEFCVEYLGPLLVSS